MEITRDRIETRLSDAKNQLEQLKQQFAATNGVIADLEYWLSEISKPSESPSPPITEVKE